MSGNRLGILVDCAHAAAVVRAAELADELGLDSVWIDSDDLLAPDERQATVLTLLAALAARTRDVRLGAVLGELPSVLPHLAEDIGVVDQASGGRLELVISVEDKRGLDDSVRALQAAWRGAPLADGRRLAVTPRPHQPVVPVLAMTRTGGVVADRCLRREDLARLGGGDTPPALGRTMVVIDDETWVGRLRSDPPAELLALRDDLDSADAGELMIRLEPDDEHLADDISLLAQVAGPVLRAASEDEAILLAADATAWLAGPDRVGATERIT